jgi:hypothetical protein
LDLTTIVVLVERRFMPMVLRQLILARWAVYEVEPLRGAS